VTYESSFDSTPVHCLLRCRWLIFSSFPMRFLWKTGTHLLQHCYFVQLKFPWISTCSTAGLKYHLWKLFTTLGKCIFPDEIFAGFTVHLTRNAPALVNRKHSKQRGLYTFSKTSTGIDFYYLGYIYVYILSLEVIARLGTLRAGSIRSHPTRNRRLPVRACRSPKSQGNARGTAVISFSRTYRRETRVLNGR
jgi:hypothetical protein